MLNPRNPRNEPIKKGNFGGLAELFGEIFGGQKRAIERKALENSFMDQVGFVESEG